MARFAPLALPTLVLLLCLLVPQTGPAQTAPEPDDWKNLGFFFDRFNLSLAPGERTEAAGPLFYHEESDGQELFATPPLLSYTRNRELDYREFDLLYPLLTYDRYGKQYRWQFLQLLSFAGGETQLEKERRRFTIFPIYFQQRSSLPAENYTALVPIYGHLKGRLNRDETFFVLFPLYAQTRKRDVVTKNFVYPVFHLRKGDGLRGWQFWPLAGHEVKEVTTRTNRFGDTELVGGHDKWSVLWPIFSNQHLGLGTTNAQWQQALLPVYYLHRSPLRDQTTVLWPFFSKIEDREKKYREWQAPWTVVVFARGEGKQTSRVLPLFSRSQSATLESESYLWPVYRHTRLNSPPLDRERTRILFFLYSNVTEKNTENNKERHRRDLWPLFTQRQDWNGNQRLQVLALLEPFIPSNKSIERNYSPLYSLWRAEHNPTTETKTQSLLWNLYRRESSPQQKQTSVLFGLFQSRSGDNGKQVRVFFIPFGKRSHSDQP